MGVWDKLIRDSGCITHGDIEAMKNALQDVRLSGYCDAIMHLSDDMQDMSHEELESIRVENHRKQQEVYNEITEMVTEILEMSEAFVLFKRINAAALVACVIISITTYFSLLFLLPIMTISTFYFANWVWHRTVCRRLTDAYYNHGYTEAIEHLADHKNIYAENLRINEPL